MPQLNALPHLAYTQATGSILVDGRLHRFTIARWDPDGEHPHQFTFLSRSTRQPIVAEIGPDAPVESSRRMFSAMDRKGSINLRGGSVSARALGMGHYKPYRYQGVRSFLENAAVCSTLTDEERDLIFAGLAEFYGWAETER